MHRTRRLVLFDIDGTLLKGATEVHREAFAHAYETLYGLPLTLESVATAGRTDRWIFSEVLRGHGIADSDGSTTMAEAFDLMQRYVEDRPRDLRHTLLPGIPGVLEVLQQQGAMLGLLTGNLRRIAAAKLHQAGIGHYFSTGGYGEESEHRADLVAVALRHASQAADSPLRTEEAVVVGDTPLDIEAGRRVGTGTVGVATGHHSVEELRAAGADRVFPDLGDVERVASALLQI